MMIVRKRGMKKGRKEFVECEGIRNRTKGKWTHCSLPVLGSTLDAEGVNRHSGPGGEGEEDEPMTPRVT